MRVWHQDPTGWISRPLAAPVLVQCAQALQLPFACGAVRSCFASTIDDIEVYPASPSTSRHAGGVHKLLRQEERWFGCRSRGRLQQEEAATLPHPLKRRGSRAQNKECASRKCLVPFISYRRLTFRLAGERFSRKQATVR
jgi:hypothetical protein